MGRNPPDCFPPGATIVTASARLARRLSWRFTTARLDAGEAAWETPDILPWNAWVVRLREQWRLETGRAESMLRPAQRRVLWQNVIEGSAQRQHLLQPAAVATRAIDAWEMLHAWGVPVFPEGMFLNDDARAFRAWAAAYRRRCADGGWIDPDTVPGELARELTSTPAGTGRPVCLVGFDTLAPAARELAAALTRAGMPVTHHATTGAAGRAARAAFQDRHGELQAAARWARRCLELDPACSIGIVVPGLSSIRAQVQDVFSDILDPGALRSVPDGSHCAFSIAAGEPLAGQPLVAHALIILALAMERVPVADAGVLLRSPFLRGAAAEGPARALLDAALRRRGEPETGLGAILAEGTRGRHGAEEMLRGLGALQERARALPARQRAPDWARTCSELLRLAGWPGDRTPSSVEFQVLSAWRDVLADLVSLDGISGAFGLGTALRHLRRLAAERAFQPQTPEAPIQALDLAGASDMGFDHLWVTGMHEDAWPPAPQPNPFVPLPLQRELGMPRSSAEAELERCRRITESLRSCCPDVIFSWPRQDGDSVLRPSPLIHDLDDHVPDLAGDSHWAAAVFAARRVESFADDAGPALAAGAEVRGGATVFKNQAACPFRAFARHRLLAEALDEVDVGLDAMERGNLVHGVLQHLWLALGSRDALQGLSETECSALVGAAVDRTVDAAAARRPQVFTARFAGVERERLRSLVQGWLAVEAARGAFTVTGCEVSRPFRLGGITGHLRMDRIDTLADGRQVILDYKTGKVPAKPWEGPRPEEPQLPLYAVTGTEPLAAVAFARVVRGEYEFRGVAGEAGMLAGTRSVTDWAGLLEDWRAVLLRLAGEFERGHAPVDPRNGAITCRSCDLHPLCRVHELGMPADGDDENHDD